MYNTNQLYAMKRSIQQLNVPEKNSLSMMTLTDREY